MKRKEHFFIFLNFIIVMKREEFLFSKKMRILFFRVVMRFGTIKIDMLKGIYDFFRPIIQFRIQFTFTDGKLLVLSNECHLSPNKLFLF